MKMTTLTLFVFLYSFAFADIKATMKKEINPAFKVIVTDLRKNKIDSNTKSAAVSLAQAFVKIRAEVPEYTPHNGDVRPITADEVRLYKQYMEQMIELSQQLSIEIATERLDAAKVIFVKMDQLRTQSHEMFRPE